MLQMLVGEGVFKKSELGAWSPKLDRLRQKGLILKLLLLRCDSRRDDSRIIKVKLSFRSALKSVKSAKNSWNHFSPKKICKKVQVDNTF